MMMVVEMTREECGRNDDIDNNELSCWIGKFSFTLVAFGDKLTMTQ